MEHSVLNKSLFDATFLYNKEKINGTIYKLMEISLPSIRGYKLKCNMNYKK